MLVFFFICHMNHVIFFTLHYNVRMFLALCLYVCLHLPAFVSILKPDEKKEFKFVWPKDNVQNGSINCLKGWMNVFCTGFLANICVGDAK